MTQQLFAGLTSPSLVNLDANFTALFNLREMISTAAYAGSVAAMTIDSNGVVSISSTLDSVGGANQQMVLGYAGGTTRYGLGFKPASNGGNACTFANAANSAVGSISTTSSATSYNTASDRRLKCAIAPAIPFGELLDAITVVQHNWIAGGTPVRHGFIAQELAAVYPEAVTPGDTDAAVSRPWAVDNSKLVPLLLLELQSLRARVALLEDAA